MLPEKVTLPSWIGCGVGSCAAVAVANNRIDKQTSKFLTKSPIEMNFKCCRHAPRGEFLQICAVRRRANYDLALERAANTIRLVGCDNSRHTPICPVSYCSREQAQ